MVARAGGTLPPGVPPPLGADKQGASPVGAVQLISHLLRRDEFALLTETTGGVDYYIDPVLGTTAPRAFLSARLAGFAEPLWTAALRVDFATAIRTTPLVEPIVNASGMTIGTTTPDETVLAVTLSAARQFSPNILGELGVRWAERGPAFVTPDFHFHQRQLWVYLAVTGRTKPEKREAP
jgi:hypothetical protein